MRYLIPVYDHQTSKMKLLEVDSATLQRLNPETYITISQEEPKASVVQTQIDKQKN